MSFLPYCVVGKEMTKPTNVIVLVTSGLLLLHPLCLVCLAAEGSKSLKLLFQPKTFCTLSLMRPLCLLSLQSSFYYLFAMKCGVGWLVGWSVGCLPGVMEK